VIFLHGVQTDVVKYISEIKKIQLISARHYIVGEGNVTGKEN